MLAGPNILLTASSEDARGFTSKISDFGLSRLCTNNAEIETKTSGTVTHAPPELLSDGHLSQAGDVFAFGVILWEMWTSQHAWSGLLPYQVSSETCCQICSQSHTVANATQVPVQQVHDLCRKLASLHRKQEAFEAGLPVAAECVVRVYGQS